MANKKKQAAYNVRRIRDFRAKVMRLEEKVKDLEQVNRKLGDEIRDLNLVNWVLGDETQDLKDVLELTISSDDGIECLREWVLTGEWPQ